MDSYKFILEDYHAIKNAEIILDGLTVLAGLNGCGKSTISRWLYGFVRFSNEFDRIVDSETAEVLYERNRRLSEVQRRIAFWTKSNLLPGTPRISSDLETEISSLQERVRKIYDSIEKDMTPDLMRKYGGQLWDALGVRNENEGLGDKLDSFMTSEERYLSEKLEEATNRKAECALSDLYRIIESGLDIKSRGPLNMQFSENGTDLLDHDYEYIEVEDGVLLVDDDGKYLVTDNILGRFLAPMGLKRAIYIDSPMSVSNIDGDSFKIWTDLKKMLSTPLKPMSEEARRIVMEISFILGGDVMVKDEGIGRKELRYVRKADGLDISIDEVATGMKSFAYLFRLLQNGYIDSETLLIIDEPEAHLHPQWIVKFAKILVHIQKRLGAKVIIASHDPDMVVAINTMAEAEGLSRTTNFYQATKKPDELQYRYVNSGNDISNIFESFNVALDRIDSYKASDAS